MVPIKQPHKKTSTYQQGQLSTQTDSCEVSASEAVHPAWHTKYSGLTKCKDISQFAFDLVSLGWNPVLLILASFGVIFIG